MFGGIEAGGTKFVCAAGQRDGTILDRVEFPTGEPDDTLRQVIRYFKISDRRHRHRVVRAD